MFPLLVPLLSIGTSLIGQIAGQSSEAKSTMLATIQELFAKGDKDQLEAEVQRLAIMAKADQTQADTTRLSLEQGGAKWRDQLGTIGVWSLGLNWLGIPVFNTVAVWVNGIFGTSISVLPYMNLEQVVAVVSSLAGIQGMNLIAQNRQQ